MFACCREIYSPKKHTGCFKGPIEAARIQYEAEQSEKKNIEESKKTQEDLAKQFEELKQTVKELYAELDAQRQAQEPKDHTDSEGDSAEESKGDKEQKPKTKKKFRGKAKGSKKKSRSNYLFYHGAKPEFGVDAASVMVNDVFRMLRRFNRKTLTTVLPDAGRDNGTPVAAAPQFEGTTLNVIATSSQRHRNVIALSSQLHSNIIALPLQ